MSEEDKEDSRPGGFAGVDIVELNEFTKEQRRKQRAALREDRKKYLIEQIGERKAEIASLQSELDHMLKDEQRQG